MCLINAKVKEVTEDIACYKVYLRQKTTLISPYQRSLAPEFNTVAKTDLGEINEGYRVYKGFHSFANFNDSIKEKREWASCSITVVVECIIPKGAKCYVGQFGDKISYCSDSIKLIELIKTCV